MIRIKRNKRSIAPLSGGEANTASNVGAAGVGPFKQKSGIDLEFKNINTAANGGIAVTDDTTNDEIDLAIDVHGLDTETPALTDLIPFSDESATGDPTKCNTIAQIVNVRLNQLLANKGSLISAIVGGSAAEFQVGGTDGALLVERAAATYGIEWGFAKRTIQLLATAGKARTTTGCGDLTQAESSTYKVNYDYLPFDASSDEYAYWPFFALSNWNAGTVTYRVCWTAASGSGGVAWALQGLARSNDDAIDGSAWGTAVVVTDTLLATGDIHWTAWSSALTVGGTPAAGDAVTFQVYRDVSDASDTLAADALLLAIEILYTTSSYTDG